MFEFEEDLGMSAKIKVIGVGGGGGNAIRTMMKEQIEGVDFVAINTDVQSLKLNDATVKIQIGSKLTKGLGSGANPQVGRDAALEDAAMIREALVGSDMIFITAGMGGGTGTGAAAIIAKIARELGILTVGVVTKPFSFEGRKRMRQAEQGIQFLKEEADTVICIPNDNLLNITGKDTPIVDSFKMVDYVLLQAVRSISDLITTPGLINLDFADIRTIMQDGGFALMGTGIASGDGRALEAAKMAVRSPLLENMAVTGATGILLNITGSSNMTLFEVNEASKLIQQECHEDANIIFGTVIDENMSDRIRMTVIATGFGNQLGQMKQQALRNVTDGMRDAGHSTRSATGQAAREVVRTPVATTKTEPPRNESQEHPIFEKPMSQQSTIRDIFDEIQKDQVTKDPSASFTTESHEELRVSATTTSTTRQAPKPKFDPLFDEDEEPARADEIADRLLQGSKKAFDEDSLFSKKPSSSWGTSTPQEETNSDFGSMAPRITRRRTDSAQEKSDFKKIISDIGLTDADADEYDIPAFIRRRAD